MEQRSIDRRRHRRIDLQVPLLVRRVGGSGSEPFREEVTANLSLAGVYFESGQADRYAANDVLVTSVSIPNAETRSFPFRWLSGRGRVVRVEPLSSGGSPSGQRVGVAVEFGDGLTALTAIPRQG